MSDCEGCTMKEECPGCLPERMDKPSAALSRQVGGNHYKSFVIQPVEFITKNNIGFLPGCIIKRACRFDKPGGKGIQDLEKIKHEIDLIIQLEEWEGREICPIK